MRTDRIKCFEEIISSVRDYFLQKANTLESSEYLQHYFGIKANPDIENEKNPTRLEVFWDDRLIDINPVDKDIQERVPVWIVWHKLWKMWIQFKGLRVQGV